MEDRRMDEQTDACSKPLAVLKLSIRANITIKVQSNKCVYFETSLWGHD